MLFQPGQIVATPNALKHFDANQVNALDLLTRHLSGDWGDCDPEDAKLNDDAVKYGSRVFSVYKINDTEKVWLITEADRSVTTFLMPEDY